MEEEKKDESIKISLGTATFIAVMIAISIVALIILVSLKVEGII